MCGHMTVWLGGCHNRILYWKTVKTFKIKWNMHYFFSIFYDLINLNMTPVIECPDI
jgi:hypothetical protein